MFEHRGDAFLRSSNLLTRLAKDNPEFYVGRLANAKIYDLAEAQGRSMDDESVKHALRASTIIAAARVAELGESPATIDFIATQGIKLPWPPLKEIDGIGAATVLNELARTNRQLGSAPLAPPKLLTAMSAERQTFYKNGQPNPWLSDYTERAATHARH